MAEVGPIIITADEINCLILSYFQDSGFQHSAFALRAEGQLEHSPHHGKHIRRGELVDLLSKALLYAEVEAHWRADAVTTNCLTPFTLLEPHTCSPDAAQTETSAALLAAPETLPAVKGADGGAATTNGAAESVKRKAADAGDGAPTEKRARTSSPMALDKQESKAAAAEPPGPTAPAPAPAKVSSYPEADKIDPLAIRKLSAHKTEVFVCAWNPTHENILASGSKDAIVNLWNVPLDPKADMEPPIMAAYMTKSESADLTALDWTPDGALCAIGSYDCVLRVCRPTGEVYFTHSQHQGPIFAAQFSPSGAWLLTASLDGTACVWDVKDRRLHMQYRCHLDCCLDVAWLDDNLFASCGADKLINILKLGEPKPVKTLSGHTNEINMIKCNPARTRMASCADDRTARVWNIESILHSSPIPGLSAGDEAIVLRGHKNNVSSIDWCPRTAPGEHELVASSGFDGTARLWDSVTGECLRVFSDHKTPVYTLTYSPDGRFFATGGGDGWLFFYDMKTRERGFALDASTKHAKPGIFEIDWQQTGGMDRVALALESHEVAVIDVKRIPQLR